jgi:hypothetical protein
MDTEIARINSVCLDSLWNCRVSALHLCGTQNLDHKIKVWTRLDHPYVLCLHGTITGFGPFRALVYPWMPNGTLNSYLTLHEIHTTMDRLHIVSFSYNSDHRSLLFLEA